MLGLPVTIEVLSNIPTSSPSILVVTPPTSLTIIFPAAISHGSSLIVKYAPIIPSATCANSNAAEPYVRVPLTSLDRQSTRLNSSHVAISYAVLCLQTQNKYCKNKLHLFQALHER